MLRQFRLIACVAVVGFASHGAAVSIVPACEPYGACHHGPASVRIAPPRYGRVHWVRVYEGGRMRLVPRVYRDQVSDPANLSAPASITPANGRPMPTPPAPQEPTPKNVPYSGPVPSAAVPPSPTSPSPAQSGLVSPVPEQTSPVPPSPTQTSPAQSNPVPPAPAQPDPGPSKPASADRLALANRAQALLKTKCARCHGENRQESGLDLRSHDSILRGGESGPGVVPGQPEESLVLQRVRAGEMPPRNAGRLSPEEIGTLQQWIAAGAPAERAR